MIKSAHMRLLGGLIVGLWAVLASAGCKEKTESYCCTSADDCAQIVECTDPGRPVCSALRTCVADPMAPDGGGACDEASDCLDPGTPFCIDQACVACEAATDCRADAPVCQASHACGDCGAEADCSAYAPGTPHCGASGSCVACRTEVAADCDVAGATPVCDATTAACRGCGADTECSSALCDEQSGACVDETDIVYVDRTVATSGNCTSPATACKTLGEGVAKVNGTRVWIKVAPGSYAENLTIDGKTVKLIGPPLDAMGAPVADVIPAANGVACVAVTGDADVLLERLELHDAGGSSNGDGVRCSLGAGSVSPRLVLRDAVVFKNAAQGVEASGCEVTITRATIETNAGGGIAVSGGTLSLTRSRIAENAAGGVSLSATDFVLVNNFIVSNGGLTSTFGGVNVNGNPPSGPTGARFVFNTVSANTAGNTFASGVRCQVGTPLAFASNIVYANAAGLGGQVDTAGCAWSYSDIGPGVVGIAGLGNLNVDPAFVSSADGDYRLLATSMCIDAADPGATSVTEDFEGDLRPRGVRADMGADEQQ